MSTKVTKIFRKGLDSFVDEKAEIELERHINKLEFYKKFMRFLMRSKMVICFDESYDFINSNFCKFTLAKNDLEIICWCQMKEDGFFHIMLNRGPVYPLIITDIDSVEKFDGYTELALDLYAEAKRAVKEYFREKVISENRSRNSYYRLKFNSEEGLFAIDDRENKVTHDSSLFGRMYEGLAVFDTFQLIYQEDESRYVVKSVDENQKDVPTVFGEVSNYFYNLDDPES